MPPRSLTRRPRRGDCRLLLQRKRESFSINNESIIPKRIRPILLGLYISRILLSELTQSVVGLWVDYLSPVSSWTFWDLVLVGLLAFAFTNLSTPGHPSNWEHDFIHLPLDLSRVSSYMDPLRCCYCGCRCVSHWCSQTSVGLHRYFAHRAFNQYIHGWCNCYRGRLRLWLPGGMPWLGWQARSSSPYLW